MGLAVVGVAVGHAVGEPDGEDDGAEVGDLVGSCEGSGVGLVLGDADGLSVAMQYLCDGPSITIEPTFVRTKRRRARG